jgi:hypothetical protein
MCVTAVPVRAAAVSACMALMQLQQDTAEDVPLPTVNYKHPGEMCVAAVLDAHHHKPML